MYVYKTCTSNHQVRNCLSAGGKIIADLDLSLEGELTIQALLRARMLLTDQRRVRVKG